MVPSLDLTNGAIKLINEEVLLPRRQDVSVRVILAEDTVVPERCQMVVRGRSDCYAQSRARNMVTKSACRKRSSSPSGKHQQISMTLKKGVLPEVLFFGVFCSSADSTCLDVSQKSVSETKIIRLGSLLPPIART